jgi:hypothetical protein
MTSHYSRKSSTVNSQLRSELLEADLTNKYEQLSPGMYDAVFIYSKTVSEGFIRQTGWGELKQKGKSSVAIK